MVACIAVSNFDCHQEEYHDLRLTILNHQPSGVDANKRDLNLFSRYLHGKNIEMITGEVVLKFIGWLREERDNQAGSINRKESSIRTYFKYLRFVQIDGAADFPIESLPRAREPYTGPVEALTPEEVIKLLNTIDRNSILGFRDLTLYTMLYSLGLRIGEALSIKIEDIDFDNEILHILGKGRRKRKLPLTRNLLDMIKKWLLYRTQLSNAEKLHALFVSKKGNQLSPRTAQDNLKKIVEKAGPFSIEKVTPHSLRHAFATHAIEGGQDIIVLKAIMGHASSKSTEIYLHPSIKLLKKAVNEHIASEILDGLIHGNILTLRVHQARDS